MGYQEDRPTVAAFDFDGALTYLLRRSACNA
jgi:hypothetical protein